ncbi:hypothetical protein [Pseudomonas sp. Irchel 3F6]|uniref:hypothetical protein n=1 Tax=Pseudomonas sp. Irchel 3F6 TaxID=2009003 RepID=UPI000BA42045|nr:hypothetical protein [Pseudomonas sp. Irchel 3F6]
MYLRTHASYIAQLRDGMQGNAFNFAAAGGSANAITATYSPAITTLSNGTVLLIKAASANTAAVTFSPNGLTAAPIVNMAHVALRGGEIAANGDVCLQYNTSIGAGSWVLIYSSGGNANISAVVARVGTDGSPGFRNKLINSRFNVNQRAYASGAATAAANQYTLDRWTVVVSGQNLAYTASGAGYVVTAPAGGIEQIIEAGSIEGGVYTLSWVGTATATVNGVAITNGGNTSSLADNTAVTIRFTGGTVSKAQFEAGTQATLYEARSPWLEMSMCMRYYQRLASFLREVQYFSGSAGVAVYRGISRMRTLPSVAASGLTSTGASAISVTSITQDQITLNYTAAAGNNVVSYTTLSLDAEL